MLDMLTEIMLLVLDALLIGNMGGYGKEIKAYNQNMIGGNQSAKVDYFCLYHVYRFLNFTVLLGRKKEETQCRVHVE